MNEFPYLPPHGKTDAVQLNHQAFTMTDAPLIRLAHAADLDQLAALELAAAERFDDATLPGNLRTAVLDQDVLARAQGEKLLWVAVRRAGAALVGFLAAQQDEADLHILEMSVHPAYGQQGVGTRLVDAAFIGAMRRGLEALTLTTFSHVAWNAPAYRRLGFKVLVPRQMSCGLEARLLRERQAGLGQRVAMRKDVLAEAPVFRQSLRPALVA